MSETIKTPLVDIRHNTKAKLKDLSRYERNLKGPLLRDSFRLALDMIGQTAVADFFITTGGGSPNSTKLTMRSGRLAASLVGAFRFSQTKLPRGLGTFQAKQIQGTGAGIGKKESIREVTVTRGKVTARIGSRTPYAGAHESGSLISITVTEKMRRFFWAMFAKTGDEKWKWMALSRKSSFTIPLRSRPYLKPAMRKTLPAIEKMLKQSIELDFDARKI